MRDCSTHGYYNLSKFHQNRIKNKRVFLIAHFCKQTAEKSADIKKGNKYDRTYCIEYKKSWVDLIVSTQASNGIYSTTISELEALCYDMEEL